MLLLLLACLLLLAAWEGVMDFVRSFFNFLLEICSEQPVSKHRASKAPSFKKISFLLLVNKAVCSRFFSQRGYLFFFSFFFKQAAARGARADDARAPVSPSSDIPEKRAKPKKSRDTRERPRRIETALRSKIAATLRAA